MAENRRYEQVQALTDQLEQGVSDIFTSNRYLDYLRTCSKFHHYSLNNMILIYMQNPNATMVAGYDAWKRNFGRQVKKGERAIKILAPTPYREKRQMDVIDHDTQQPVLNEDGTKKTPIMIHRVCFGSIERFIGVLTEHFAGKFPTWLAPMQVKVLTLPGLDETYAKNIFEKLQDNGIRVELDNRNEKIGYKVREARQVNKVPYMLIIGKKEIEEGTVSVRDRDTDQTTTMPFDEFLEKIKAEIESRD